MYSTLSYHDTILFESLHTARHLAVAVGKGVESISWYADQLKCGAVIASTVFIVLQFCESPKLNATQSSSSQCEAQAAASTTYVFTKLGD